MTRPNQQPFRSIGAAAAVAALTLAALAAGCQPHSDADALPPTPPLGSHVDELTRLQTHKARADQFVIYQYEWASPDRGAERLSVTGDQHLREIARRLPGVDHPVVIEPSGDAAVDARRRNDVIAALTSAGVGSAALADRVIVAVPDAPGIPGEEAANVDSDTPRGGQTNGSSGSQNSNSGIGGGGIGGSSSIGGIGGRSGGF